MRRPGWPRWLRWPLRFRMTAAWVAMGLLVTVGFYAEARDDQLRCRAGNQFRRQDLPVAFHEYSEFLGHEFGATDERIADANARFALVLDDLFPERQCSLLW